jgi:ABC-type uncharacterized transport system substrate-binding protein
LRVETSQLNIAGRSGTTTGCPNWQPIWCAERSVIAATGTTAALAAKAASATIPIVFEMAGDPIKLGLVASLNRPGSNITGVTQLNIEVAPKRLELLHEIMPMATTFALLINSSNPTLAEPTTKDIRASARALAVQLHVGSASTDNEIDDAFASLANLRVGGLVIGSDPFVSSRSERLASVAVRYGLPAIYQRREFALAGGLMSYGSATTDAFHLAGIYSGRVLKGEKPADLPVQQATKGGAGHQPQNRQGTRHHGAASTPTSCSSSGLPHVCCAANCGLPRLHGLPKWREGRHPHCHLSRPA